MHVVGRQSILASRLRVRLATPFASQSHHARLAHTLPPHTCYLPAGAADGEPRQTKLPAGERPVACLFGWVGAPEKALRKYASLYTRRGVDVIALMLKPAHVALPVSRGRAAVSAIADALSQADTCSRPLIIQGFSAGAYMYGNLLIELDARGAAGLSLSQRIRGCVWDSPVDLDGVPFGLSRAVMDGSKPGSSEGSISQRLLQATLEAYLHPAGPMRQYYQASSDAMHGKAFAAGFSSPLAVPSAFIYSEADTVTRREDIETVCGEWRAAGSDVEVVAFEGTKHVMHMLADPARYDAVIGRVLQKGLGDEYA